MKAVTALVAALALAAASAAVLAHDSPAHLRTRLQAIENRVNAASARKDVNAVMRTLTTDFRATDHRGRVMRRAQVEQQMREVFRTLVSYEGRGVVGTVTLPRPGVATATVRSRGVLVSRDPSTGQRTRLEVTAVTQDTWVRTRGQWLRSASTTRSVTARRDGKPIELP
ncbi:MAG TPA: nuclear transport factor 2 family protein [Chthonomonadales bacterium]|nr:nuclear transport factor 2 family protein [Chthonomonadales bacterium]